MPDRPRDLRILLVEDDPAVAAALAKLLALDGHRVDVAGDGAAAADRLESEVYDVILTDLFMPNVDGYAFYSRLAAARPDLARRVGIISANIDTPVVDAFLRRTGVPAAGKPLTLADARRLIRAVLHRQ
jgi:CheY-like chemotaxis protein